MGIVLKFTTLGFVLAVSFGLLGWRVPLNCFNAVASSCVGGCFVVFSDVIMPALGRTPHGMVAMRQINDDVVNLVFIPLFILLLPTTAVSMFFGAGLFPFAFYAVGFAITIFGNLPLNAKLKIRDDVWPDYLTKWTALNTARAATCLASSIASILAIVDPSQ